MSASASKRRRTAPPEPEAPAATTTTSTRNQRKANATSASLEEETMAVIIGAGMSGLTAARKLKASGVSRVVILEARTRVGGRIKTTYLTPTCPLEQGAMFIHGDEGNPIAALASSIGAKLYVPQEDCDLFDIDGTKVDKEVDDLFEAQFNRLLDLTNAMRDGGLYCVGHDPLSEGPNRFSGWSLEDALSHLFRLETISLGVPKPTKNRGGIKRKYPAMKPWPTLPETPSEWTDTAWRVLNWHAANIEGPCAAPLSALDLRGWDQDDKYEYAGNHCLIVSGYSLLTETMAGDLDIRLGCRVTKINQGNGSGSAQVYYTTSDGVDHVMRAEAVICTLPLGILKAKDVEFEPELDKAKQKAISRLGFGLFNKVLLYFPKCFWAQDRDYIGLTSDTRGKYYLILSMYQATKQPALIVYIAGEAAYALEAWTDDEIVADVYASLRRIYGETTPAPAKALVTRWNSDPFSKGSYSFVKKGASGSDYDTLAQPAGPRLYFAGEHTSRKHPATVAGAYISGLREANRLLAHWRIDQPEGGADPFE